MVRKIKKELLDRIDRLHEEDILTEAKLINFLDGLSQPDEKKADQKLRDGTMTKSDWQKMFGHLDPWDKDFNEKLYSLGSDDNTKAEEHGFDKFVTGHEALAEFENMKRKPASLWACGRYINDNPNAQKEHSLIGIGARRGIPGYSVEWFPVFDVDVGGSGVDLDYLEGRLKYYRLKPKEYR